MTLLDDTARCLEHEAFVYAGDDEYVDTLVPLIADAVAAGRPVIAVVPAHRSTLLRDALGDAADAVSWIDAGEWYRHPVRTIAAYEQTLRRLDPGASAVVIGEVQFGETERDWLGWTRYEAALNRALDRHAVRIVCPYDARSLPPVVLEDARRTHSHVLEPHGRRASDTYVEPEDLLHDLARPVVTPSEAPLVELTIGPSIREGRQAFQVAAASQGLPRLRIDQLSVAVSEVLTNAVVHGGGAAQLRIWCRDGNLTCVVEDTGLGSDDALLGYVPPPPGAMGGYGLWLTRQLFDRTELARSPGGGLVVRLDVEAVRTAA
ncbi:MAG TPA: anti-sigma factor RsbA family regulatory protein [Acidimicrobiales bacterium]|nr:anti-sigma factor RsbA family regulatory protein [Acidimicrobiales bacterium]